MSKNTEENKILTTEDFFSSNLDPDNYGIYTIHDRMVEFAKYHVELALKSASKKAYITGAGSLFNPKIDKDSILNSYNLDNIK